MALVKHKKQVTAKNPPVEPKGHPLYLYYDKQVKSCMEHAAAISKGDLKVETIHQFRISLKKIRTIYELEELLTKGQVKAKKKFKLFKDSFRAAGKIREKQLNIKMAGQYLKQKKCLLLFKNEEDKLITKNKIKLQNELRNFDKQKLKERSKRIRKALKKAGDRTVIRECEKFIYSQLEEIEKLLDKKQKEENFHTMRTDLKKAGALLALLGKIDKRKMNVMLAEHIRQSGALIGKWHDLVVFTDNLSSFTVTNKKQVKGCEAGFQQAIDSTAIIKKQMTEEFSLMLRNAVLGATLHKLK